MEQTPGTQRAEPHRLDCYGRYSEVLALSSVPELVHEPVQEQRLRFQNH